MATEETTAPSWMRPPVSRWSTASSAASPYGRQDRALRSRRVLVAAAAREIDRHGYHAASVRDILAGTGLTKGALYFHFGSKDRLVVALIEEIRASWTAIADEIATRDLDPLWRLLVETDAHVARWMHDPLVRGATRAMCEPGVFTQECDRWMRTSQREVEQRLEEAADAGLLRPGVSPAPAARLVCAACTGHHTLAESVPDSPDLWERTTDTWQAILPFIATPNWVLSWSASPWATRPAPRGELYRAAADPDAVPDDAPATARLAGAGVG